MTFYLSICQIISLFQDYTVCWKFMKNMRRWVWVQVRTHEILKVTWIATWIGKKLCRYSNLLIITCLGGGRHFLSALLSLFCVIRG